MTFHFAVILPTTRCLAPCELCCYEAGYSERVPAVDFRAPLEPALESLVRDGLEQVIITGGEPLLAPHLDELVALCARRVPHLLLMTRGELLDADKLAALEQAGVDDIALAAAEVTDSLREAVHCMLFHSRYVPTLMTSLTAANARQVPELLAFSSQLNLQHLFTPSFIPLGTASFERLSLWRLPPKDWRSLLEALEPWAALTESEFYLEMVEGLYHELPVHPGFCPMGTHGLVIDADGTVYPCLHRRDLAAGNLLRDAWPQIQRTLELLGHSLLGAPCFGEHCLSLFAGIRE